MEHEDEEDNKRKPWPSTFARRVVAFFGFHVLFFFFIFILVAYPYHKLVSLS